MARPFLFTVIFVLILLAAALACLKPALTFVPKKIIEKQIPGSQVSIEKGTLKLDQLTFENINVRKPRLFEVTIKEINAFFTLPSLLRQDIPSVIIKDVVLNYKKIRLNNIQGHGWIKGRQYMLTLDFSKVDLAPVLESFELNEKLSWNGVLNGQLTVSGDGERVKILSGHFLSESKGGTIVIKDDQFLRNMAQNSRLPPELVVDSFKNYHYNNGLVRLGLEEGSIVLDVALEGETGKRNLKINLHDFIK